MKQTCTLSFSTVNFSLLLSSLIHHVCLLISLMISLFVSRSSNTSSASHLQPHFVPPLFLPLSSPFLLLLLLHSSQLAFPHQLAHACSILPSPLLPSHSPPHSTLSPVSSSPSSPSPANTHYFSPLLVCCLSLLHLFLFPPSFPHTNTHSGFACL